MTVPFPVYSAVVILVLGLLLWFGGNFTKNAAASSVFIHYIYVYFWKMMITASWVGSVSDIMMPVIVSCFYAIAAYLIPGWRKAWQKETSEDSVA